MRIDWRRRILQLPSVGELTASAVRAAYWRLVGGAAGADKERLQDAKRELLFELGVRIPSLPKPSSNPEGPKAKPIAFDDQSQRRTDCVRSTSS